MYKIKEAAQWLAAPLMVAAFTVFLVLRPTEATAAARAGAALWYSHVLPALLPFCVCVNLLAALGALDFAGAALAPLTRLVFGVSGQGGCALALGMTGGYPVGAKTVCALRAEGKLGRGEAQRLLGFANNSGPMFIVGALGAGMFGNARVGWLILAAHYLGAFTIGVGSRLFGKAITPSPAPRLRARRGRVALGKALPVAISDALETVVKIGGFMVLFAVVSRALDALGVFGGLRAVIGGVLPGATAEAARGLFLGAIEMTTGAGALASAGGLAAYAGAAAVVSWGGLSIHAQTMTFIGKTDLSAARYMAAKALHGGLAAVYTLLLYPPLAGVIARGEYAYVFAPYYAVKPLAAVWHLAVAALVVAAAGGAAWVAGRVGRGRR